MMNFVKRCLFDEFVSYLYVTDAPQVWHPIYENYIDQGWHKLIVFSSILNL